ncbi:MAG TPA: type I methionyl aminopeptidase [Dehalococcoidia bacterium]|nr:type I methionyl aminopeptidase [Chloroflexota bacterium]HCE75295.1 type I methionyl aminopeptidase [Dehalococcoidia bacterium]|tara:strand:+ start:2286 stop:3071 length:786 start_codon:yes stop_codon:yes gene_type:complete
MTTGDINAKGITIKSSRELDLMREAGRIIAEAKLAVKNALAPGVTSLEMDALAEEIIKKRGAIPSFKGYQPAPHMPPFPASICFSFNEEIVHGIPSERKMREGDIVSVDFGAIVEGYHGDSAFTAGVGSISDTAQRLIDVTSDSLDAGIKMALIGSRLTDISNSIQIYAESKGYSVVKEYVGHGIGRELHEEPQIPNYGSPGRGPLLREGMVLAIEPMLNVGSWKTKVMPDGWTIVTIDGELSAHSEHTVAITSDGPEVLT